MAHKSNKSHLILTPELLVATPHSWTECLLSTFYVEDIFFLHIRRNQTHHATPTFTMTAKTYYKKNILYQFYSYPFQDYLHVLNMLCIASHLKPFSVNEPLKQSSSAS